MLQIFILALLMGIAGSFHCVGMCGPIALALPLHNNSVWSRISGAVIYNSGRIATYTTFGLVFGIVGKTVSLFGFQQWLSIFLGVFIISFIIIPKKWYASTGNSNFISTGLQKLRSSLAQLFTTKNNSSLFYIGVLNGLLPCGLVYMAAAGSVASGTIGGAVLFMAAFGLGTIPVMWSLAFFGNYISMPFRVAIRKAYPYMMALVACLLILRGMGLGIPYVSPALNKEKGIIHNCCHKP